MVMAFQEEGRQKEEGRQEEEEKKKDREEVVEEGKTEEQVQARHRLANPSASGRGSAPRAPCR